jgi:uncharacterized protein YkwD
MPSEAYAGLDRPYALNSKKSLGGPQLGAMRDGTPPSQVLGHVDRAPLTADPSGPVGPRMLDLINDMRMAQGLQPLTISRELTQAANLHANDIARSGKLSHYGTDGANPLERVRRLGYEPRLTAENIAGGHATVEEALKSWKQSEIHSRNLMLPNAVHVGIGVAGDPAAPDKRYWTLVIGAPAGKA